MHPDEDPKPAESEDTSAEEAQSSPSNEALMVWFGIGGAMSNAMQASSAMRDRAAPSSISSIRTSLAIAEMASTSSAWEA